jgi:hypothetical protein
MAKPLHPVSNGALELAEPASTDPEREAVVLRKALLNAAKLLELSGGELAAVLGTSEASISRMKQGARHIASDKEWELAVLFLRFYRSLDSLAGPQLVNVRLWFNSENVHLGGVPRNLIRTIEGLTEAVRYLDAMRGKL